MRVNAKRQKKINYLILKMIYYIKILKIYIFSIKFHLIVEKNLKIVQKMIESYKNREISHFLQKNDKM